MTQQTIDINIEGNKVAVPYLTGQEFNEIAVQKWSYQGQLPWNMGGLYSKFDSSTLTVNYVVVMIPKK